MNVQTNPYCENCPARILSKEGDFHENIGNIMSQVLFVLPRYDEVAIKDLFEIYNLATGKPFEENCNLTYAVKCTPKANYRVYDDAIIHCRSVYFSQWVQSFYEHTFVIGDSWKLICGEKPSDEHIAHTFNGRIFKLHFYNSLGIKYYSNTLFEAVKDKLIQDIRTYNI